MSEIRYETIIYWAPADSIFVVEVPELPGCKAHGSTKMDALRHAEEAAQFWMDIAVEEGRAVPEPQGRLLFA